MPLAARALATRASRPAGSGSKRASRGGSLVREASSSPKSRSSQGRVSGSRLEVRGERPLVLALALRADQRLAGFAAREENHGRHGEHAVAGRGAEARVDVELDEANAPGRAV